MPFANIVDTKIGHKFGRLTLVKVVGRNERGHAICECLCDCGNTKLIIYSQLSSASTKSCGCLRRETTIKKSTTHGRGKPEYYYKTWKGIKQRCNNPNNPAFKNYGGRGIKMHLSWLNDFAAFHDYIINTLKPRPSSEYTLDRIDNDKGYEPGNVRWALWSTQSFNKRSRPHRGVRKQKNRYLARISHNGERHYLGLFLTEAEAQEVEAQAAHDAAALVLHGFIPK